jgi:hypothetical protein
LDQESIQTDSYAYDGNGQLIDARNPHIQLQWFPDAAGNVRTEHHHYLIDDQGRPSSQPMTDGRMAAPLRRVGQPHPDHAALTATPPLG